MKNQLDQPIKKLNLIATNCVVISAQSRKAATRAVAFYYGVATLCLFTIRRDLKSFIRFSVKIKQTHTHIHSLTPHCFNPDYWT